MTVLYDEIMVRYGELSTKGKNRGYFINRLAKNIREVLADMPELKITAVRDRAHIELNGADYAEVSNRLTKVFGIQNFFTFNQSRKINAHYQRRSCGTF